MTNPTIVSGYGKTFSSSGTATLTLYGVQSEDIRKSSGLIDLPMPTMDSNGKIVMDLMGASREITIEGIVTISDVGSGNLYKYAKDLVGLGNTSLITGTQGSTGLYTYTPESLNRGSSGITISIVVSEVSVKSDAGNPNAMHYSITMIEYGTLI